MNCLLPESRTAGEREDFLALWDLCSLELLVDSPLDVTRTETHHQNWSCQQEPLFVSSVSHNEIKVIWPSLIVTLLLQDWSNEGFGVLLIEAKKLICFHFSELQLAGLKYAAGGAPALLGSCAGAGNCLRSQTIFYQAKHIIWCCLLQAVFYSGSHNNPLSSEERGVAVVPFWWGFLFSPLFWGLLHRLTSVL